jgi:HSP20 family molecular chaperone IbpA
MSVTSVPIQTAADDLMESFSRRMFEMMGGVGRQSYYRFSRSISWEPAVNIQEDEEHIYLCVEVAGLSREKIIVEAIGQSIRICGERPIPQPPKTSGPTCIVHMEINSGAFERIVKLPDRADLAQVDANLDAGFLWVTISKKSEDD